MPFNKIILDAVNIDEKALATAWVNFNATGTLSVRDSYNVSSVSDLGVGAYFVNFAVPMDNSNYAVAVSPSGTANGTWPIISINYDSTGSSQVNPTVNGFRMSTMSSTGGLADFTYNQAIVFGGKN